MLDGPDRIEAERLGHLGQAQLVAINLGVGKCVAGILENRAVANVHDNVLLNGIGKLIKSHRPGHKRSTGLAERNGLSKLAIVLKCMRCA